MAYGEQQSNGPWQPYHEPLRTTLMRTVTIALVVGGAFAWWRRSVAYWPFGVVLVLWFSLGGHYVELWFLNHVRPRLSARRAVHVATRSAVWFIGGVVLGYGMQVTAQLAGQRPAHPPAWWLFGLIFISVELIAHLALHRLGRPNVYNGRG